MKRVSLLMLVLALLGLSWGIGWVRGAGQERLRVVFHINTSEEESHGRALKNIRNLLAEAPDTTVVAVCHGPGINLVLKERSQGELNPRALQERGVSFVACRNTMRERGLTQSDLLPGVTTVAAGTLEVVRKQHEGFAYFKP